jgi:hypothetical protein
LDPIHKNWLGDDTLHDEVGEEGGSAGGPKKKTCLRGLRLQIIQDGKLIDAPWSKGYPEK